MKILIADDHAIVRRGLREILEEHFPDCTVGEAADAAATLANAGNGEWDLLLLDLSMPGRSGLDLLHDLRVSCPRLSVLVLSVHPEEQYGLRVIRAGAAGYLNKEAAPEALVSAVRRVLAGGKYVGPALAEQLASSLQSGGAPTSEPHQRLSDREFQVLARMGQGRSVKEIAAELSLSEKTVSTYRARVLEKLGLHTTAELIRYAHVHGLVP